MEPRSALSRQYDLQGISPLRQAIDRRGLVVMRWLACFLSHHWLAVLNCGAALALAGSVAIPYLMASGVEWLAAPLFAVYAITCTQNPAHSFFIFGQQMALCQRELAIYCFVLMGGLQFALVRRRARPLSLSQFLVLLVPIVLDGVTQGLGWRESNPPLRTLTGAVAGAASVWFVYPRVDEFAALVRALLERTAPRPAGEPP